MQRIDSLLHRDKREESSMKKRVGILKNRIFGWLESKKNEDSGLVQFFKWCYSIGKISWIHAVVSACSGILIPIFYEQKNWKIMSLAIVIAILDIIYAYICNEYQKQLFISRKFTSELLEEFSSLIKSLSIFVENDVDWKSKIYRTTSEMVCEKIYNIFKEVFKCETRISVEYTFQKKFSTKKPEKQIRMAGRKSRHRSMTRKSIPLELKNKYYSYQIFVNNNKGMNILSADKIQDKTVWYKNPENNVNVKRYIGIAVSVFNNDEVNFILQIDFLDDYKFGKNDSEEDIKSFVDKYLLSYINIVTLSYLLNLNGKKELIEV